jgi:hypothetical protein
MSARNGTGTPGWQSTWQSPLLGAMKSITAVMTRKQLTAGSQPSGAHRFRASVNAMGRAAPCLRLAAHLQGANTIRLRSGCNGWRPDNALLDKPVQATDASGPRLAPRRGLLACEQVHGERRAAPARPSSGGQNWLATLGQEVRGPRRPSWGAAPRGPRAMTVRNRSVGTDQETNGQNLHSSHEPHTGQ